MKEKIIIVLPTLPAYRLEFLLKLHLLLNEKNKELVVITGTNNGKKEIKEIFDELPFKIIRTQTVGFKLMNINFSWQKQLLRNILNNQPEKVITMFNLGNINYQILLLLLKVRGVPFILWGSGYNRIDLNKTTLKFKNSISSFFEKSASGYITYGRYFAEKLIEDGYPQSKIVVAQNTINIERIIETESKVNNKRDYEILKFLFVGAIIPQKKLENALLSCKELMNRGYSFSFDIVGDGIAKDDLEKMKNNLGLNDFVFFHGSKFGEEVAYFFRNSNVFLLPGTGGLAINEAMAYSLPIICTPGDGTANDLVYNNENGFLLEYNYKAEELTSVMAFCIQTTPDNLIKMGEKSLEIIESKANLNNMAERFVEGIEKFN